MFNELIDEYNNQLSNKNTKNINNFNLEIITNKDNKINNILMKITNKLKKPIDMDKINKNIKDKKIINLIENYLIENNIEYIYKKENFEEDTNVDNFLRTIINHSKPVLSKEEEYKLFDKYKNGDKNAKKEIVEHNYRLVLTIASKYSSTFLSTNDLFEVGIIGLYDAIDKFDYKKGYKFSTYAISWIKARISDEIFNKNNIIRIPKCTNYNITIYKKVYNKLRQILNREPTDEEIAANSNLTINQIAYIKMNSYVILSLDSPTKDNDDTPLGELIIEQNSENVEYSVEQNQEKKFVNDIIDKVVKNERELTIIQMRYGLGNYSRDYTLEQIAKKFGLTRERVRQILYRLELKIKKELLKENYNENIYNEQKKYIKK